MAIRQPDDAQSAAGALDKLAEEIRVCPRCDLALTRTHAAPGEGDPHAMILFVGEAPGAAEDKTGRPFVGASGKFLDAMLADIGLQRSSVFIANVNRCRPPNNRDPNPREVAAFDPPVVLFPAADPLVGKIAEAPSGKPVKGGLVVLEP